MGRTSLNRISSDSGTHLALGIKGSLLALMLNYRGIASTESSLYLLSQTNDSLFHLHDMIGGGYIYCSCTTGDGPERMESRTTEHTLPSLATYVLSTIHMPLSTAFNDPVYDFYNAIMIRLHLRI